jgi:DNA-directed RNA polymerase specialized sigma24 family protein
MANPFETACLDLHAGRINFDRFLRLTQAKWHHIADELIRRYRAPGVDREDLAQIMMLNLFESGRVQKWEPDSGLGSISHYAIRTAKRKAAEHLHLMRSAKRVNGSRYRSVSEEALPVSWVGDGETDPIEHTPAVTVCIDAYLDASTFAHTTREKDVVGALARLPVVDEVATQLRMPRRSVMYHARNVAIRIAAAG